MQRRTRLLLILIALPLVMLSTATTASAQVCGSLTLTSQAEVDAVSCTSVTGNLTISGPDIADLSPLSSGLHRCSIYANEEAGSRLMKMLEMGASRPWPEALEVISGQSEMDATAIADYFAPLAVWLDEQNVGNSCGW